MASVVLNLVLSEARIYSGKTLNATILVDSTDADTVVQEFVAEVHGVIRTGWINIHTDKIYETEQEFFSAALPLCEHLMPLRPGRHRFALNVALPDTAPSSFESQFGSIRYTVKLSLLTNSEQSSATEIFPFFVVSRSFFDDVPHAIMQPIDYRDEIDFTVCSLPFGTVYLQISLPRTGFRLGESITARIHVKNATRKTIKDCRLYLLLKTQFEAMSRYEQASDSKLVEQIIDTLPLGRVKTRTEKIFDNCLLRVPETAMPTHNYNASGSVAGTLEPNQPFTQKLAALMLRQDPSKDVAFDPSYCMDGSSAIILSYVLRFTALPGIETEIPIVVTTDGFRNDNERPSISQSRRPSNMIYYQRPSITHVIEHPARFLSMK